jgi:nicotinamidase-related amidase
LPVDLKELLGRGAAVLTSELQRGVIGDRATFPALRAACDEVGVIENTARLLHTARAAGIPVVHCTAEFRADRAGTSVNTPLHSAVLRNPEHLLIGTDATQVVPELGPEPGDLINSRTHGVSVFGGTSLDALLRNLGVRVVIVTGVSTNVAVIGTCIEAVNLGYQAVVPADCVAGVPAPFSADVLRESIALVATVSTADDVITALSA